LGLAPINNLQYNAPMTSLLSFIIHWLISGLAVVLTGKIISGFEIRDFTAALIAAAVIGLSNAVIWPILFILTLPINILTLGLFTFIINGAVLKICAALVPGFDITSWGAAILGAIVLSIVSVILHYLFV
jgi:putative membrane protein